jgi:hypothetical protein
VEVSHRRRKGYFIVSRGNDCQKLHPFPLRWAYDKDTSEYREKE